MTTEPVTRSERRDESTGVTERLEFVGSPGASIFTVSYLPPGPTIGTLVLAPTLLTDRVRLYRTEVLAARRLAVAGYAVVRFDYRGFGHSDGVTGSTTFAEMVDDLHAAVELALKHASDCPLFMIGSRLGTLVIDHADFKPSAVVLWDPVLDGRSYVKSAFRAHMVGRMSRSGSELTPKAQLENTGMASVLGYSVSMGLVQSLEGVTMRGPSLSVGSSILWLEPAASLSEQRSGAVTELRAAGADLLLQHVPSPDDGWFVGAKPYEGDALVEAMLAWFEKRV